LTVFQIPLSDFEFLSITTQVTTKVAFNMTNQKTPESMDIDFLRADTMSPMPFKTISNPDFYLTDQPFHFNIPEGLTQEDVEANPQLKLVQHDLLVLTSFPDNTTLHWRPSWFPKPFKGKFWTLQSPPDVVSEFIHSSIKLGVMTRRARMDSDPPAHYLSDWDEWANYCYLHDVPADFLCEDHVRVMRLGLEKSMSKSSPNLLTRTWTNDKQALFGDRKSIHSIQSHTLAVVVGISLTPNTCTTFPRNSKPSLNRKYWSSTPAGVFGWNQRSTTMDTIARPCELMARAGEYWTKTTIRDNH
jgi:hypothetical protein